MFHVIALLLLSGCQAELTTGETFLVLAVLLVVAGTEHFFLKRAKKADEEDDDDDDPPPSGDAVLNPLPPP